MISLVDIFREAKERGASDVHLVSGVPPSLRVHGVLIPLPMEVATSSFCRDLIFSVLTENQRARFEEELELDFLLDVNEIGRFRANAHYSKGAVEASFRLVPDTIPDLASLGHYPMVEELLDLKQGLILVTGATGAGKSTTLASMVQTLSARESGVIVTIEDPIEYLFQNQLAVVKQREVGHDTKSFAAALKHVLRQDPDVIVISEMRDRETIQAAITASETGHLVFGSLHTIDAPKSIDRMVDIFPADQQNQIVTQLSNSLQAVLSQRLLPRADGQGRVMVTELMIPNTGIRSCIRDRKTHQIYGLLEIGRQEGMHTIDDHLLALLEQGLITEEEALLNARDPSRI
jgi:twitching motility protein PilT